MKPVRKPYLISTWCAPGTVLAVGNGGSGGGGETKFLSSVSLHLLKKGRQQTHKQIRKYRKCSRENTVTHLSWEQNERRREPWKDWVRSVKEERRVNAKMVTWNPIWLGFIEGREDEGGWCRQEWRERKAGLARPREGACLSSWTQSKPLQTFDWSLFICFYFLFFHFEAILKLQRRWKNMQRTHIPSAKVP